MSAKKLSDLDNAYNFPSIEQLLTNPSAPPEKPKKKPKKEEAKKEVQTKESEIEDPEEEELVNVIDKSKVGRPKVLQGEYKAISAKLKKENYVFAKTVGGKYGGMVGYINWLIEEDRKRRKK